jgi:hypothetical protein
MAHDDARQSEKQLVQRVQTQSKAVEDSKALEEKARYRLRQADARLDAISKDDAHGVLKDIESMKLDQRGRALLSLAIFDFPIWG